MRAVVLSMAGAAVLVLVGSATSFASDVNCGIVMKSVKMGVAELPDQLPYQM